MGSTGNPTNGQIDKATCVVSKNWQEIYKLTKALCLWVYTCMSMGLPNLAESSPWFWPLTFSIFCWIKSPVAKRAPQVKVLVICNWLSGFYMSDKTINTCRCHWQLRLEEMGIFLFEIALLRKIAIPTSLVCMSLSGAFGSNRILRFPISRLCYFSACLETVYVCPTILYIKTYRDLRIRNAFIQAFDLFHFDLMLKFTIPRRNLGP